MYVVIYLLLYRVDFAVSMYLQIIICKCIGI